MKISICIPTYNTPIDVFDLLINKIIKQTYRDLEIYILDDGSNVTFANHLKSVQKIDSRIRLEFNVTNLGIYETRNILIKNFSGELCTFIDSDDYVDEKYIQTLFEEYQFYGAKDAIVGCTYKKFTNGIPFLNPENISCVYEKNLKEAALMGKFGHNIYGKLIPSACLKRIVINSENGFDDAQIIPNLFKISSKYIQTFKTYYFYRQREGSIMHLNNYPIFQAYKTYLYYLKFAKDNSIFSSIHYLEQVSLLTQLKLCAVNYDYNYCKKNISFYKSSLKRSIKENGLQIFGYERKYCILAVKITFLFVLLYRKKRHCYQQS